GGGGQQRDRRRPARAGDHARRLRRRGRVERHRAARPGGGRRGRAAARRARLAGGAGGPGACRRPARPQAAERERVTEGAAGAAPGLLIGAPASGSGKTVVTLAPLTGWPVVLVVDAKGQGASVAALLQGFASHRANVAIAGVIFNRVAGEGHAELLARAAAPLGLAILGWLPRSPALALPERHL